MTEDNGLLIEQDDEFTNDLIDFLCGDEVQGELAAIEE